MDIQLTQLTDIDRVCELWADAIEYQKRMGHPQYLWDDREAQKQCILSNTHYKLTSNGEIIGVFNIQDSDEKIWRHMNGDSAIYLHGVLIDSRFKGQGLFQKIMDWLINYCQVHEIMHIRLDSWAHNPPLENYYKSFGFDFVEHYQIPDEPDLPLNCRGNKIVLMEYKL